MRILILCTGNSCRSQMAEGFLKSFDSRLKVYSAGTHPAPKANPNAVEAMKEAGIDISGNKPKDAGIFLSDPFDYVITVCDDAKETCPYFSGQVGHRLHMGFEDPAGASGTFEEVMPVYRRIRDAIKEGFWKLYRERIKPEADREAGELKDIVKKKHGKSAPGMEESKF
jgi:arsenate reductase